MNTFLHCIGDNCTSGEVRLAGGSDQMEGRVEVCISGVWGTVSHSGWNGNAARVVCRQLGYSGTGTYTLHCDILCNVFQLLLHIHLLILVLGQVQ